MAVNVRERKLPGGGTHWQTDIRVRLPSGRLYRERLKAPASTRAQAMRWARQREAYILRNGLDRDVVAGGARCPTLREFMPRFMADYVAANRLKPATRRNWEQAWTHHLLPLFGRSRLAEIGPADIQRLKRQPVAPGTVNLLLGKLGTVLRVAREWGLIAEVPRIKKVDEPADSTSTAGSSSPRAPAARRPWRSSCSPATRGCARARSSRCAGATSTRGAGR